MVKDSYVQRTMSVLHALTEQNTDMETEIPGIVARFLTIMKRNEHIKDFGGAMPEAWTKPSSDDLKTLVGLIFAVVWPMLGLAQTLRRSTTLQMEELFPTITMEKGHCAASMAGLKMIGVLEFATTACLVLRS